MQEEFEAAVALTKELLEGQEVIDYHEMVVQLKENFRTTTTNAILILFSVGFHRSDGIRG